MLVKLVDKTVGIARDVCASTCSRRERGKSGPAQVDDSAHLKLDCTCDMTTGCTCGKDREHTT